MRRIKYELDGANLPELFDAAKMVDSSLAHGKYRDEGIRATGTEGYCYAYGRSLRRKENLIPSGPTKGHYGVTVRKDTRKFFCRSIRQNNFMTTYLKPTKMLGSHILGLSDTQHYDDMQLSMKVSIFDFVEQAGSKEVALFYRLSDYPGSHRLTLFANADVVREFVADLLVDDANYAGYKNMVADAINIERYINAETNEVYETQLSKAGYFIETR